MKQVEIKNRFDHKTQAVKIMEDCKRLARILNTMPEDVYKRMFPMEGKS